MKTAIRKWVAAGLGAVTTGMSLIAPAMAANLQDYPAPFVDDGNTNFLIVVGQSAATADVVGSINVAVRLGAERGEDVAVGTGTTTISGADDKELALNEAMSTFGTLKDNKLAGFQDTKIRWNSKDVDIEEQLLVTGVDIVTSDSDKDLGSGVFLGTGSSNYQSFRYSYVISDSDFDYTLVNTTSSKRLDIKFLGRNFQITRVTNGTTDKVTYKFGVDDVLGVGDTKEVDGVTVKINSIGQTSASISIGSDTQIISSGEEYDFGDMVVKVNAILYTDDVDSRQVDISVGSDISKEVSDGESMEVFGEPDDETDANWVWYIDADDGDTGKLTIGAQFNQKLLDHKDDLKAVGEALALPDEYAKVYISSLTTDDYAEITGEFDNFVDIDLNETGGTTGVVTDKDAFVLTSDQTETGFRVNVSGTMTETKEVYIVEIATNQTIGAFKNSDNKVQIFYTGDATNQTNVISNELQIYYQDTALDVNLTDNPAALNFTIVEGVEGDGLIVWDINLKDEKLGTTQGQAAAAELTIGGTNRGTVEEDYRTHYGMIIRDPDSNGDSDKIAFAVPSEQVKANVVVEGPDATSTTTTGSTVKKAVPIVDNIARLDTEVTESMKQNKNLILVGGPCVNLLTAQAMGFTTKVCGADSGIPEGAAMIKVVNDAFNAGKAALIVAGWEAPNTRAACSVLQQYSAYDDLTGTAVVVQGTDTPTLTALE
ncbi:MAG: S-layer protein [Candidatus Aenigmatarchaeota archaeon]